MTNKHNKHGLDVSRLVILLVGFIILCYSVFTLSYNYSNERVQQLKDINYIIHTKDGNTYRVYGYSSPDETSPNYTFTDENGTHVSVTYWNWDYAEPIYEVNR